MNAQRTKPTGRPRPSGPPSSPASASGFWQSLGRAYRDLARGMAPSEVWHDLLEALLDVSESQFAFLGEVLHDAEGSPYLKIQALTNIAWNPETRRLYEEQGRTGLEFRNLRTLFGACLTTKSVVIANDPEHDERSGGLPDGHPRLDAFLGIPLIFEERMVGMAGVANRRGGYDEALVHELQPFLDSLATLTVSLRKEAERRAAAVAAAEKEAHLSAIVGSSAAAILTIDERGAILSANPASQRMLGYSPEELRGRNVSMLMPEPHRSHHDRYIASYLESGLAKVIGAGREVEAVRKDGSVIFAHLSLGEVRLEGRRIFTGILQDVTERRQAQRQLEESLADLRRSHSDVLAIFNQLEIGAAVIDEDGRVAFANEACTRPAGSGAEFLGQPWEELLVMDEVSRPKFRDLLRAGEGPTGTLHPFRIRSRAGALRHVDVDVRVDPREVTRRIVFLYDVSEVRELRERLDRERHGKIVGASDAMERLYGEIDQVARGDWTVLLEGETGTGKELVARAIHAASGRRGGPFVAVNCAGLTESILASQLFGHARGAFTGATSDRQGLFQAAAGGTLFLDEIGDVTPGVQSALLRTIQEKEVVRLGESRARKVDVRFVAATNKDLAALVDRGAFREDLLYRIRVGRISVPPLRDRRSDIPALVAFFLAEARVSSGKLVRDVSPNALERLVRHDWPGNVRELRSAIEYAAIGCRGRMIRPEDLPPEVRLPPEVSTSTQTDPQTRQEPVSETLESAPPEGQDELTRILAAIEWAEGNRARAARKLGISSATLYRRLGRYAIPAKRARHWSRRGGTGRPE